MYERVAPAQRRLLTWPTADICASVLGRFDPDPDAGFFTGKKGEEVWHQTVQQWDHLQAILDKCFRHAALHQINRLGRTALMEARLSLSLSLSSRRARARARARSAAAARPRAAEQAGGDRSLACHHSTAVGAACDRRRATRATIATRTPHYCRTRRAAITTTTVVPTAAPTTFPDCRFSKACYENLAASHEETIRTPYHVIPRHTTSYHVISGLLREPRGVA